MQVFRKTRLHWFFYAFILQDNRKRKEPGGTPIRMPPLSPFEKGGKRGIKKRIFR